MKIGFDAKRAFFNNRGLGNYSRDTIRILSLLNPQEKFYLFSPDNSTKIQFNYGVNCQIVSPNSLWKEAQSLWRTIGISKDIKSQQIDIYHGLSNEIPLGLNSSKVRTVVTMHDLIFLQFPKLYPFLDRYLYKKKYIRSCSKADKIIAISNQTKSDLINLIGIEDNKVAVVYQGCNPIFKYDISDDLKETIRKKYKLPNQFILNVGALEQRKNQLFIIKTILDNQIDIPLVIVGHETQYLSTLKKFVEEHNMVDNVIFLTEVSLVELPALYQMSMLFVYPSIFEGFGIPIIEAMTSRVPVITSLGSCFRETGGDAAIYIDPHNEDSLATAINKVVNDEDLKLAMICKGLNHINKFSDETISHSLISIYNNLL